MATIAEVKDIVVEQGRAWEQFKSGYDATVRRLDNDLTALSKDVAAALLERDKPQFFDRGEGGDVKHLGQAVRLALKGDDRELKAMSVGNDAEGGYLVVPQFDSVVRTIRDQVAPIVGAAREITLDRGNTLEMPRVNGTQSASWVGESAARPEIDTPDVGLDTVTLHEIYTMPAVTQRLLDDANYDVGALILDMIAHGFAAAEETAMITGTGVGQPRGIATYTMSSSADSSRTWGQIQYIAAGAAGAFATDAEHSKLVDTIAALAPQYRSNARWLMSRSTAALLQKVQDTTGRPLWSESLVMGQPSTLLGYPVTISDQVAAVAADSLSIWFGDFRAAYTRVVRPGIQLLRDPYTNKPWVNFYATMRAGGQVVDSSAIKAIKFAAS